MPTLYLYAPTLSVTHGYVTPVRVHMYEQNCRKYGSAGGGRVTGGGGKRAPPDTEHAPSRYQRMYSMEVTILRTYVNIPKYTIQSENPHKYQKFK
jgi:hypothetical protein